MNIHTHTKIYCFRYGNLLGKFRSNTPLRSNKLFLRNFPIIQYSQIVEIISISGIQQVEIKTKSSMAAFTLHCFVGSLSGSLTGFMTFAIPIIYGCSKPDKMQSLIKESEQKSSPLARKSFAISSIPPFLWAGLEIVLV